MNVRVLSEYEKFRRLLENYLQVRHIESTLFKRRISAVFGVPLEVIAIVWVRMQDLWHLPLKEKRIHLLWAINFLKVYNTENVAAANWRTTEKTYREKVRLYVDRLAALNVINFEDRCIDWPHSWPCCSIDGTDFLVTERHPFDSSMYSHKLKHAGLRYEVALSLGRRCRIVWFAGGVPAGAKNDLELARDLFVPQLQPNERVLADKGYPDENFFWTPIKKARTPMERTFNVWHKRCMARHETINAKLKTFNCLRTMFRQSYDYHRLCVFAIANLINLSLMHDPSIMPTMPLQILRFAPE